MKIGKRLIAFMLVILTLATVSINSINLAYADGGAGDGAGNISGTGGSKSGTWSSDRTGIRVYVVDKSGNLMSNIVDIISDTKMPQYKTAACFGTRGIGHTQIYNAGSIKANQRYDSTANMIGTKTTDVIITTADDVGLTENGMPIQDYKNKVFTTSGETLKNYMLGSSGKLWQGGNSGGGGGTTGNVEEDNNIGETVNSLTAALQSRVDAYTKVGYEHSVIVVMIGEDIISITNDLVSATNSVGEPMFSQDEISVMVSAMYDFKKKYEASQTQTMGLDLPSSLLTAGLTVDVAYADENTDGIQLSPLYDDGYLIDLMDFMVAKDIGLFDFNAASGIKKSDWATDAKGNQSFIATCAQHGYIVFMEPLFYSRLNDRNGYASTFMFYGTISNYGKFINDKNLNQGWSNGDDVGGNLDRALHKSLAWSMYTENDLQLEGKAPIIRGTKHPNFNDEIPNGNLNNSQWWGFGLHYYILSAGESSTHTYDSHNYPITNPEPHGDNPNYKEHPAPDPKTDPCTSDKINSLLDKAHYRIVKVYDQEVLYASIDENGELNLTKGTEHVSTHVREQTLPKIEVQDEMPEYRMVEWKYTYDQYVPVTEGGTESTKWEDEPIAGRTVVNKGSMPEIVDITNPNDANAGTTLYVHLLKKIPNFDTRTWDEPNYPDGTPAEAPEPPDPGKIPIVTDEDDPPIHIEDLFPADIKIVKVYRTHNLDDDTYTYDGTYVREGNPHAIQIDNEPMYKLKEWFTSTKTEEPSTWDPTAGYPKGETGTSPKVITVQDPNKTLYVLLEREAKSNADIPQVSVDEDLTESQLTKISTTNSGQFGWSGYSFKATLAEAKKEHTYTLCRGCTHSCSSDNCTHSCSGHCGDRPATCGDMTRAWGDDYVSVTFGMKQSWHDKHETSIYNSGAHPDFDGKSYGKGGQIADSILFEESGLSDNSYKWELGSDGSSEHGIAYITTISRASVGDKLNLAQYKQNSMNATSYDRVNTIFPAANKPIGKRLANGVISESIAYTIGHIAKDDTAISTCAGCGCPSHHTVESDTKKVQPDKTELRLSGSFKVFTYGGKQDKVANQAPTNIKNFAVTFTDDGRSSTNSALYTVKQTAKIEFYPYVKMSYMITKDNINFPGYTDPNASNGRTVYMLSDKKSTILPTNSVEASWYNNAQADGGYGLQMTSAQWSVHNRAVQGDAGWQGPNQVLPGGALYQLKTKNTETYVKTITYNTLVEKDSRTWINVTDPSKYTTDSIIKSTQDYLNEAKNVIENFRIVQWVSKDIGAETAWQNASTSVKISAGGESLSNLGLPGKASTDSKYLLVNGTDNQAVNEADLDIEREYYQTTVYKGFTDVKGDIYIAALTVDTENKMLDQATLDKLVNLLKPVCGTNIQNSLSGLSDKMTYSIVKIGSKADKTATILNNLQSSSQYNYLYTLDLKTKFITNLINSVERNTGDDTRNATWTTDGKWYNEAFDGVYEVVQSATFKIGLGIPSLRTAVLDPNLCPAKASTSQIFTNAFKSQFCIDSKSSAALDEDDGYIGTYEGVKVYLPDLTTMYISRPFYIPNANVQDTTT